jgi:molybdenum ABC transporter molybdate-binding protein
MTKDQPESLSEQPAWGDGWSVGLRLWVERGGAAILGQGRLELLEGIDRQHSISAAAREMGMSYRRAWELVQSINQAAGAPLVHSATGGMHGGGARLTPQGRWTVTVFRELQNQVRQTTAGLLPRLVERSPHASLHVAAAVSLEEAVGQLLTDFALQDPTVRVRTVFGASDELADHLLSGASGDVFLTADPRPLDRLKAAGLLEPDSQVPLAENGLAAIALSDNSLPVHKPGDLRKNDMLRVALAVPDCPLGRYTKLYLESRHLYDCVLPRAVLVENSRAVLTAVRAGQADLGLVYSSDAACAAGCRTLFRARQTPFTIRYFGAVLSRGHDRSPAQRFLDFLTSAQAAHRLRACGFQPVKRIQCNKQREQG